MGSTLHRFETIKETLQDPNNLLSITELCDIAGVSRSGYYRYLNASGFRESKEARDRADFELILNAYKYRGYNKGARSIYMRLLHLETPVIMNIKKIRRLMKKYNLFCPIRKANPYREWQRLSKQVIQLTTY